MAGSWTSEHFPRFEEAIRRLTEQHRELKDEPLHLALSYGPNRDQQDVFLFEVVGSATEDVNPDRELFEATFHGTPGFPLGENERLHLILTNLLELEDALRDDWPSMAEIVDAIRTDDFKVLYSDEAGARALGLIREKIHRQEVVSG